MAKRDRASFYDIQWSKGKANTTDAFYVRAVVFMAEQGFKNEFDELDARSWHVIVYDHGEPIGTGRVYQKDGQWHAGRIAVIENYRGKGVGRVIMDQLHNKVRELGGSSVLLSAQVEKQGFYKRQGYKPQGETYLDEHCPHIDMVKELKPLAE